MKRNMKRKLAGIMTVMMLFTLVVPTSVEASYSTSPISPLPWEDDGEYSSPYSCDDAQPEAEADPEEVLWFADGAIVRTSVCGIPFEGELYHLLGGHGYHASLKTFDVVFNGGEDETVTVTVATDRCYELLLTLSEVKEVEETVEPMADLFIDKETILIVQLDNKTLLYTTEIAPQPNPEPDPEPEPVYYASVKVNGRYFYGESSSPNSITLFEEESDPDLIGSMTPVQSVREVELWLGNSLYEGVQIVNFVNAGFVTSENAVDLAPYFELSLVDGHQYLLIYKESNRATFFVEAPMDNSDCVVPHLLLVENGSGNFSYVWTTQSGLFGFFEIPGAAVDAETNCVRYQGKTAHVETSSDGNFIGGFAFVYDLGLNILHEELVPIFDEYGFVDLVSLLYANFFEAGNGLNTTVLFRGCPYASQANYDIC